MELTGIAIFYFLCAAVGFIAALLTAIFGEITGHASVDAGGHDLGLGHGDLGAEAHDIAVGHEAGVGTETGPTGHAIGIGTGDASHMPGASFLNTLTMLVLLTFFGMAGLFAVWVMQLPPGLSFIFALPVGLLAASAEFVLYVKVFVRAQSSSEATMSDILGCQAEVITTIPADRVGEIAYVIKGTRYNAPAVSAAGEDIARGAKVQIVNIRGTTLVVRIV